MRCCKMILKVGCHQPSQLLTTGHISCQTIFSIANEPNNPRKLQHTLEHNTLGNPP